MNPLLTVIRNRWQQAKEMNQNSRKLIFVLGITLFILGCKNDKRYFDKQGNEFIEKGDELYIVPTEYQKTGESYKIFCINKTDKKVSLIGRFELNPSESKVFEFNDRDTIIFDFGPKIYFGDYGLEYDDDKSQLAGIGGKYWEIYNVPDEVEYGFVIVEPGKGDNTKK